MFCHRVLYGCDHPFLPLGDYMFCSEDSPALRWMTAAMTDMKEFFESSFPQTLSSASPGLNQVDMCLSKFLSITSSNSRSSKTCLTTL